MPCVGHIDGYMKLLRNAVPSEGATANICRVSSVARAVQSETAATSWSTATRPSAGTTPRWVYILLSFLVYVCAQSFDIYICDARVKLFALFYTAQQVLQYFTTARRSIVYCVKSYVTTRSLVLPSPRCFCSRYLRHGLVTFRRKHFLNREHGGCDTAQGIYVLPLHVHLHEVSCHLCVGCSSRQKVVFVAYRYTQLGDCMRASAVSNVRLLVIAHDPFGDIVCFRATQY